MPIDILPCLGSRMLAVKEPQGRPMGARERESIWARACLVQLHFLAWLLLHADEHQTSLV